MSLATAALITHIPEDLGAKRESQFDPVYMRKLFDFAYALAKEGYPRVAEPPGFAPPEIE